MTRFARKSTHANKAEDGTATWEEFDNGLRVLHSEHERDYTPDVYDSHKVLDWDAETDALGEELGDYRDVKMSSKSALFRTALRHFIETALIVPYCLCAIASVNCYF